MHISEKSSAGLLKGEAGRGGHPPKEGLLLWENSHLAQSWRGGHACPAGRSVAWSDFLFRELMRRAFGLQGHQVVSLLHEGGMWPCPPCPPLSHTLPVTLSPAGRMRPLQRQTGKGSQCAADVQPSSRADMNSCFSLPFRLGAGRGDPGCWEKSVRG